MFAASVGGTPSFAAVLAGLPSGAPRALSASRGGVAAPRAQIAASVPAFGQFVGRSVGSGQCVALVRANTPAIGATANWVRGEAVQGNTSLPPGTAIATFTPSGRYANAVDGSSHAAIYLGQNAQGMQVLDQWAGSVAAVRTIAWNNPGAVAANTGSAFYVVRPAQTGNA